MHIDHAKASILGSHLPDYMSTIETMEGQMNPIKTFRAWRRYTNTVRELNKLNSRQLSDLGISRSDIDRVARATA